MQPRARVLPPVAAAIVLAGAAVPLSPASAAFLTWDNPGGGQASVAANWTPAQVPAAADVLQFDLPNLYTVFFSSTTPTSSQMLFREGNTSLAFNSPHTVSQIIRLGDLPSDSVTARLNTGSLTVNGSISIADVDGTDATLMVRTGNMTVSLPVANTDVIVGTQGEGTLIVESGGTLEVADDVIIGANAVSEGYVTVKGRSVVPLVPSNLVTTAGTSSNIVVGSGGYGELHVEAFALVFVSGNLQIAPAEHQFFDGNGIVTVGGGGTGLATVTVDQNLQIGTGSGGQGGDGTLSILSNGLVEVNGTTFVGAVGNDDAIFNITGGTAGGTLRSGSLIIDDSATFNHPSGRVIVDGGSLNTDGDPLTINGTSGSVAIGPYFELTNGATASPPDTSSSTYAIQAGTTGFGGLKASNGGHWTPDGDVGLGISTGGVGLMEVTTGGSLTGGFTGITVGGDGTGTLNVTAGGILDVQGIGVGTDFSGMGTMNVDGSGSEVTLTQSVTVGANIASAEPVNVLSLTNSSTLTIESPSSVSNIQANGGLSVSSSAQITTAGDLDVRGEINLNQGFVVADSIRVSQFGAELNGVGFIAADVVNNGITAPGLSAGELEINGTFNQTSTGKLRVELGDHDTGECDLLSVTGPAVLGGALEVALLPSFDADALDAFTIMTFTSRTGTFASVTLDGGPLTGFTIEYTLTAVRLKAASATHAPLASTTPITFDLIGRRSVGGSVLELMLPFDSDVQLSLFDVGGREVGVLREGRTAAGRHPFEVGSGSRPLASGIYFGRAVLSMDGRTEVRTARVPVVR